MSAQELTLLNYYFGSYLYYHTCFNIMPTFLPSNTSQEIDCTLYIRSRSVLWYISPELHPKILIYLVLQQRKEYLRLGSLNENIT